MPRVLIERYELGPVIGAGAMAKVHIATDRFLDRKVAVKVLDDEAARSADPAARTRFLKEARSAAGFAHHNAVSTFDAGEDGGVLFIVMEYVDGHTLAARLADDTRLSLDESVSIATQVLQALAAMHERGILHRDVKPANVLLTANGGVKLTDFGIAKRLDEIEEALTASGTVVGTPRYLAPEQAVGGELGPATDVYLTGIVLHEMLTGERPPSALMGVPTKTPDPRRLRPEVPAGLAAAVTCALEFRPERRHPSATAMIAAIGSGAGARDAGASTSHGDADVDLARDEPTATIAHVPNPADDKSADTSDRAADHSNRRTQAELTTSGADGGTQVMPTNPSSTGAPAARPSTPPSERTMHTADLPAIGRTSWLRWLPIVAAIVLISGVGIALALNRGGDARADPAELAVLSTDEFLAELHDAPGRFGPRGDDVRDQLDALLAESDPERQAAARTALEVDIFTWVAGGELDSSVGGHVAAVLDG